jgi:hypothetical protein
VTIFLYNDLTEVVQDLLLTAFQFSPVQRLATEALHHRPIFFKAFFFSSVSEWFFGALISKS